MKKLNLFIWYLRSEYDITFQDTNVRHWKCQNLKPFLFSKIYSLCSGVVTSPKYPGDYPNGLRKNQAIKVKAGMALILEFTAFDIQYHGDSSCDWDHLTITDSDGTILMKKNCGISLPPNITSSTGTVHIMFVSDETITRTGWSIRWRAVTPGQSLQCIANTVLLKYSIFLSKHLVATSQTLWKVHFSQLYFGTNPPTFQPTNQDFPTNPTQTHQNQQIHQTHPTNHVFILWCSTSTNYWRTEPSTITHQTNQNLPNPPWAHPTWHILHCKYYLCRVFLHFPSSSHYRGTLHQSWHPVLPLRLWSPLLLRPVSRIFHNLLWLQFNK